MQSYVFCLLVVVAAAAAAPQREGAAYTKEAIKQAQNTHLIPQDAVIQKVRLPRQDMKPGIELKKCMKEAFCNSGTKLCTQYYFIRQRALFRVTIIKTNLINQLVARKTNPCIPMSVCTNL